MPVSKQIDKMSMVIEGRLDYESLPTSQAKEVLLCQQVLHQRLYTNQILRKICKYQIVNTAEAARQIPELQHILDAVEYQGDRLLRRHPSKRCILESDKVRSRCMDIISDLYEVSQEIMEVGQSTYHGQQCRSGSPHRL
ncbi:MAG: hypothetical protein ACI8RA_003043 [Chlamydiales bacterium]